jgi:sugar/nucleoside kinase (ribokinase family)
MRALFLGGHTFDVVYRLEALPALDTKARADFVYTQAGGPALNAAITCAILGGDAVYAGALGAGALTDAVVSQAARYGVTCLQLGARDGDAPCASIALTPGGARTIWSPPHADTPPGAQRDLPDLTQFDALLVDGQLADAACIVARAFREVGKPVVLDAGSWKPGMGALTQLATETIAGAAFRFPDDPDTLRAALEAGALHGAVTAGADQMRWAGQDGQSGVIKPPQVVAVDTLAAGDVFHGAYLWFRHGEGCSFESALDHGVYGARDGVVAWTRREGDG